ncbi:PDZ domain-containing protein [Paludisphaera mucosa]|uniref:PDZ domain-containing protein n=1 Tax=Paludisphaera mucosa TaxID=3030827 RepID=A0ABT6F4Y4_9BACT|nr:PDZ domain-containing protein [Paludisphaera mucosa]MDG3002648.1 PDZ domain-containing protein [Paludisphaera mucosa]
MKRSWWYAAAALAAATIGPARAQQAAQPKEGAAVIVEGAVREVFRSTRGEQADFVVQVDVARTELGRGAADARRLPIPAPGDAVYIHVRQAASGAVRGSRPIPSEGATLRAYLYPRAGGGWEGASPDWYDQTGGPPPRADSDVAMRPTPAPTAPASSGEAVLKALGVKAEPVEVNGRLVLKITEILPETPAQKAGFEKGDVIIGVNRAGFASLPQFAEIVAKGGPVAEFVLVNVRDKEQAAVKVDLGPVIASRPAPDRPSPAPTPSPAAPKRSLGAEFEPVRLGLRSALKVTKVQPESPAQKAGFEVGDVLVEAGGIALSDETKLQEAVDKAGEKLTVTVRDSRTGRDVPVEVVLGAAEPKPAPTPAPEPDPAPAPSPGGGVTSRSFGLTVKPGTADLLPVVKVAAVASGSPAEKAGLEVGDAIVGVDDRVVFAPDLFEEALKNVGSSFTLTVLDVKSGKKTPVKVQLGR